MVKCYFGDISIFIRELWDEEIVFLIEYVVLFLVYVNVLVIFV